MTRIVTTSLLIAAGIAFTAHAGHAGDPSFYDNERIGLQSQDINQSVHGYDDAPLRLIRKMNTVAGSVSTAPAGDPSFYDNERIGLQSQNIE